MKHILKYLTFFLLFSCQKEHEDFYPAMVKSFSLEEFPEIQAEIKENSITIILPYGTFLKDLTPKIITENAKEIVPNSKFPQDFSKPVYFTLIGENGKKIVYIVSVKTLPQPTPIISSIEKDTIEAGLSMFLKGDNFGNFGYAVKTYLLTSDLKEIEIPSKLNDSTKIALNIPIDTKPGKYKIKVKVNALETIYAKEIVVSYPSPQIEKLSQFNILNSDTLWITGNYLDPTYKYSALFKNKDGEIESPNVSKKSNLLGFVPKSLVGRFEVYVKNISEAKISRSNEFNIKIWDSKLPFVESLIGTKTTYKKGETLLFKTINFEQSPARFYQVQLKNSQKSYIQNGLFSNGKLSVILPENIIKGKYSVSFMLSDPEKNYSYTFENDIVVEVID